MLKFTSLTATFVANRYVIYDIRSYIAKANSMIHLSQAAANEISRLQSKQQPKTLFRLAVKAGGCSGLFYDMSFDETIKADDRIFDLNNLQVVIDSQSWNYINGLALDYSEDLMGGGFRFDNPQAMATCGCGNSFSTTNQESIVLEKTNDN